MKKFLSLVLALVMTMSLVTISAGAKDFTDDSTINYKEAVDVMSSVKVIDGYADGSFNPQGGLTRGAAAKIICNMILGPTTAAALSANDAPFKDVPADHTFAGYIAYCANEGIISGYADGTFRPAAPLTGYAFMKMLLGALGYDADIEGYTGANWSIQVAKRALNIELDSGLKGEFVGAKALTREEACLYAFNTMKSAMVDYGNKTSITVGDITVTTNAEAQEVTNEKNDDLLAIGEDGVLEFCEKYFTDLEGEKDTDKFGRPATTWYEDGDKVGTYTKTPKYTFTFDKDADYYEDFTDDDLLEELRDITGNKKLEYDGTTKLFMNGAAARTADLVGVGSGVIVELYCSKNDITTAVVLVPFAAQITDVDDELSNAETKKGASYEIELSELDGTLIGSYYDDHDTEDNLPGFDAKTYTEDTVLVIFPNFATKDTDPAAKADEILASYVAETETGTLNTWAYTDKYAKTSLKIDGTKYPMAVTISADGVPALGKEQTIYMTEEGFVVGILGVNKESIDDVYYVTGVYKTTSTKGSTAYYAETVALDGTTADLKLESGDDLIDAWTAGQGDTGNVYVAVGDLYILTDEKNGDHKGNDDKYDSYLFDYENADESDNYNGYFVLSDGALEEDVKATATKATVDGLKVYLDSKTAYVGVEKSADSLKANAATGGMKMAAVYGDNDTAARVIVLAHVDDTRLATNVIYITEDLNAAVATDEILYVTRNGDIEVGADTVILNAWFMTDVNSEEITIDEDDYAVGFAHFSVDDDDVYSLSDPGTALTKVDDKTDGFIAGATIDKGDVYNNALTLSTDIDDVDFSGAKVIDDRDVISGAAYDREIDSVSRLVKALDVEDSLTVDLYVKDGEIVFICVYDAQV